MTLEEKAEDMGLDIDHEYNCTVNYFGEAVDLSFCGESADCESCWKQSYKGGE